MELATLMKENDATVLCLNQRRIVTYGHSDARIEAIKIGRKIGFLTQNVDETPSTRDLNRIHSKSLRLGKLLEKTHKITLFSGSKHRLKLEFSLDGRKSFPLSSILTRRGDWGAMPDYAEAAIAPIEGTAEGRIEIDGMIMGYGSLKSNLILDFKDGKIVSFSGKEYVKQLNDILHSKEESVKILCELGLGANHLRTKIRGEFDDKKMLGSAHIALGDNHTIGGRNVSNLHVDFLVRKPRIRFDGKDRNLYRV